MKRERIRKAKQSARLASLGKKNISSWGTEGSKSIHNDHLNKVVAHRGGARGVERREGCLPQKIKPAMPESL